MSGPRRKEDLIVEWIGQEALVYCSSTSRAFCLNPVASRIFTLCDGEHTPAAMANSLTDLSTLPDEREASVSNSLAMLEKHGLLQDLVLSPSRRDFLKVAAVLVPTVLVVGAPLPAMAASTDCINNNSCATGNFGCNPCDPGAGNANPPDCSARPGDSRQYYCMRLYHIPTSVGAGGVLTILSTSCRGDSIVGGGFPNCEPETTIGATAGKWHRTCDLARQAVIDDWLLTTRTQSPANYKCCYCG